MSRLLGWAAAMSFALASIATAQDSADPEAAVSGSAVSGSAAILRGLDKVNGRTADAEVAIGGSAELLGLLVTVTDCRYPADNPTGDAYAFLTIRDPNKGAIEFEGWMIASSPALNALDHSRYDIWVLRCNSA